MITSDFFKEVAMAEEGGFGIWYEYLAKSRIFKKYSDCKKVLIFGLPEKYSLGLDTLFFADNSRMYVVESRKKILNEYKKYVKKFSKKVNIVFVKDLKKFNGKVKFDLLISTEVIQNNISLLSKAKTLARKIIIFVPNKKCYAHPKISKLNSMSLNQLKSLGKENDLKILEAGYVDCPPWPAGARLPKSTKEVKKQPIFITFVKFILNRLTPFLAKLDRYYVSPWKELNSHMIYCIFKND